MPVIQTTGAGMPSVALVSDYREEGWVSMDVVSDMLHAHLPETGYDVRQVCAPWLACFGRGVIDRAVNRFGIYPTYLSTRARGFDLYHVVDHSYAHLVHSLPANRTIVTCHDIDAFRCLLTTNGEPRPWWFRKMARRIWRGLCRAVRICCDSKETERQMLEIEGVDPGKVRVIPIGVDPVFTRNGATVFRQQPYLMHVGSTIPRKRIDILLRVLSAVNRVWPEVRLVRVGGRLQPSHIRLMQELGIGDVVEDLGFLSREHLAALYRGALAVLQPSEREGFGLPVAEALACGTPVVASDIPALRETGGDAAMYCEVADVEEWTSTVLQLREELRCGMYEERRARCLAQARKFRWEETARLTAEIYDEVLAGRSVC